MTSIEAWPASGIDGHEHTRASSPRRRGREKRPREVTARGGLWLIGPVLLFFLIFDVFPVIYAGVISLYNYDFFSPPQFVGLSNFERVLTSPEFWNSVKVTLVYTAMVGPISWLMAFGLALLLQRRVIGKSAFTLSIFVPIMASSVAMAIVWQLLLQPQGPINEALGIEVPWLTQSSTALIGIAIMGIWQSVGWFMVVFLAGLTAISPTLFEAARLDGANSLQILRYVTAPLMKPVLAFVVVHTMINGLKVFTPMFLMTGGGPNRATTSYSMLIYETGLKDFRMGQAAAMSLIGLIGVVAVGAIYFRLVRAAGADQE